MHPSRMHPGEATSPTLLSRVRDPADRAAWAAFEARYRGLLLRFSLRQGLQHADAEDVVQVVLTRMVKALPRFVYDPKRGRFRDYLYRCARNAIATWKSGAGRPPAGRAAIASVDGADPCGPPDALAEQAWEEEWVAHHFRMAVETVQETFEPRSVEVFQRSIRGEPLASVAQALGISEEAAKKARQRIKARLEAVIARQIAEEDDTGGP